MPARGGDRVSSYGDAVAVSDRVDLSLANLQREVSDLIIAPDYDPEALALLQAKKMAVISSCKLTLPMYHRKWKAAHFWHDAAAETQYRGDYQRDFNVTSQKQVPDDVLETLVATVALKYTQFNSICVAYDGRYGRWAAVTYSLHQARLR